MLWHFSSHFLPFCFFFEKSDTSETLPRHMEVVFLLKFAGVWLNISDKEQGEYHIQQQ